MYYESDVHSLNSGLTYALSSLAAGNRESVVIQPQLWTNDTQTLLVRFDAAPTLTNNDGAIGHLESAWFEIRGYTDMRFLVVNRTTGVTIAAGVDDNVLIRGAEGKQVVG